MRVAKEKLLLIAGFVWFAAGLNIAILGVSAFSQVDSSMLLALVAGAVLIFAVFHAGMFSKLVGKHADRIEAMEEPRAAFWKFFDAKGYLIMAFMMTMGIGLRASGVAPVWFIAFFYTGLGGSVGAFRLLLPCSLFPQWPPCVPVGAACCREIAWARYPIS